VEWVTDLLMSDLADAGFDTFVETSTGCEAFIPENRFNPDILHQIVRNAPEGYTFTFETETIGAKNWNEEWEKNYFQPLVIKNQVVIRAPFHTGYPECSYEIVIEPNMAFGTGNHETTSMMMETMLEMDFHGKRVLDMGCGTGILAILSGMLGSQNITAIDIDRWSYDAALENAQVNRIQGMSVFMGDAGLLGRDRFDIILANIQKNVIVADLPKYAGVLNPGGQLLVSGFYTSDMADIETVATKCNLIAETYQEKNGWALIVFRPVE
jgi:ribosomal protein L11 methyltransferase